MADIGKVFLLPGEYFISKQPHLISTLLGSCVAVCLYHPQLKFGGMNHYMLPSSPTKERSGKYGDYACGVLLQFMERTVGTLSGLQAIVSGGANVINNISTGVQIGQRNIEVAREILKKHNIPIIRENVGGTLGLKLHYQNWDNKLTVEQMDKNTMSGSLISREETGRGVPGAGSPTPHAAPAPAFPRPAFGAQPAPSGVPRPFSQPSQAKPAAPARPSPSASAAQLAPAASTPVRSGGVIKVLIVDDSSIVRNLLSKALEGEPDIRVIGAAKDAYEAREMLLERGPDVMTLDIVMPKMDGVTFLKKLMVYFPVPVIICSTIAKSGSAAELRSDKIGAVDVIDKESLNLYRGLDTVKKILIPKIRAAAKTRVVKKSKEEVAGL
ncbi:MAG: response regulator [Deltaproteobacteria bacterium]|jgi:chemotaxis receptor (MCP) glutamine deamidase CheD/CheY-like chemotaxis protein|nr:response regulator [Deltaproteobacteria bacterium]